MAGRTFRQTGYNHAGDKDGVDVSENPAEERTGTVLAEDGGNLGENRIEFEPATDAPINVTTDADDYPIEPTSISDTDQQPRKRRQRSDKGTQRRTRQTRGSLAQTSNLEKMMLSLHLMAATFLHVPELRIDEQEAAMLTKATRDLFIAYGVPEMTEKQLAIGQAAMAVATVYGPRVILVMHRKQQNKPKLVQPIIPFPAAPVTQAVQEAQKMQQPVQPVAQTAAQPAAPQQAQAQAQSGFVSSQIFAAETSNGLDTINAS